VWGVLCIPSPVTHMTLPMLLLLLLFTAQLSSSQRRQHSVVTEREIKKRTLDVVGSFTLSVAPDIAVVRVLLETLDKSSATEAYSINNKLSADVIKTLGTAGVSSADISTASFTVGPSYTYETGEKGQSKKVLAGMLASQELTVRVRELKKVSNVLDSIISSSKGKAQINSVDFKVDSPRKYAKEARAKAILDAQTKAQEICSSTHTSLGKPLSIHEDGADAHSNGGAAMMMRAKGSSSTDDASSSYGASVPLGKTLLTHTVFITYELIVTDPPQSVSSSVKTAGSLRG